MANPSETRRIIEKLIGDRETELMQHDLERMLSEELSKPAEVVDAQLVRELTELLEEDRPTGLDKQRGWERLQAGLPRSGRRRGAKIVRRIAASAAAVVAVCLVSFGTAKAFNWTFLLKLLTPMAETFGLYSVSYVDPGEKDGEEAVYAEGEYECIQRQYDALAEVPETLDGYRARPGELPERFTFQEGALYDDGTMAVLSLTYGTESGYVTLAVTVFRDEEDVFFYEFERTLNEPAEEIVAGRQVTRYRNHDDERLSVSWVDRNAHYSITGDMTDEEMEQTIRSWMDD